MKKSILRECLRIAKSKNTEEAHPEWGNFHHFAFIIQDNKIVEWATNRATSSVESKLHAETEAFRKARGVLDPTKSFECVNVRLNKKSDTRISAPCPNCYNFLRDMGCTRVFFTTDNGFARELVYG